MSVLKTKRSLSSMQFYNNAVVLRSDIAQFVMNEDNIPKRWRVVLAFPTIELANNLVHDIIDANSIQPRNLHECDVRRDYQTKAIGEVEKILDMLQFMLSSLSLNANKLISLTEALVDESSLLRGWRKSDNRIRKKFGDCVDENDSLEDCGGNHASDIAEAIIGEQ